MSPVPDGFFKLRIVHLGVAPGSIQTTMPEVIRHQCQVARFVMESCSGRMTQRVNSFELNFSNSAGCLEPLINGDPRPGRQEVTRAFF